MFEREVYDQLDAYLDQKKLLYTFQFSFRSRFSTDTCLIHLIDFIVPNGQRSLCWHGLTGPLKGNHKILLMKLEALGLNQDVVRWFRSYLSDRQQLVDVSGMLSSCTEIKCGVPQGLVLGHLLFLIYVNDMSGVVSNKLLLYADDSAILVADKHISNIETLLKKELEVVSDWLIDNKLISLHLGKTESILFGP